MPSTIFRQDALARRGETERLDALLRVTSARAWIVLTGLVVVLGAVLIWGLFGRVEERLILPCGLVLPGERHVVVSPVAGSIVEVRAKTGEPVEAGGLLAQVWSHDLGVRVDLTSPFEGTLAADELVVGNFLDVGDEAAWIRASTENRFEAVAYATAAQARQIDMGMDAWIVAAGGGDFGPLNASVDVVPDRPVTSAGWLRGLGLPEPHRHYLLRLELSDEPNGRILEGDLCRAGIVIDSKAPLRLLGSGAGRGVPAS